MPAFRTMLFSASLAVAAAIVPTAAAHAAVSGSIDIGDTATLLARGAGVSVPVTVTCTSDLPLAYGYVNVNLTQRQGQTLAQGGNSAQVSTCNGTPQTYTMVITGNQPFKTGEVLASSSLGFCDVEYTCTDITTSETIRITR
jgi:hypothetical protein